MQICIYMNRYLGTKCCFKFSKPSPEEDVPFSLASKRSLHVLDVKRENVHKTEVKKESPCDGARHDMAVMD